MLSNPCSYFVNGHSTEAFTHEGGPVLYHFSPKDCELSTNAEMNVIFFANDKEHAKRILTRMLRFKMSCLAKQVKAKDQTNYDYTVRLNKVKHLLENQHRWKFSLAPTNQFYLVGWACNDLA